MKRLFPYTYLLFLLLLSSCEDNHPVGFEDFYDSYRIANIYLEADREFVFDGDDPVTFIMRANDDFENDIYHFGAVLIVNNTDTLDGLTFLPEKSGQYNVQAHVNNLLSNVVPIKYIDKNDIKSLSLDYQGYDHLTTNPWSVTGDFIITGEVDGFLAKVDLSKSSIPVKFSNGFSTIQRAGVHLNEPGEWMANAAFNGLISESIKFIVREEKEYSPITFPVIYHFINSNPNIDEINRALASYNEIFNNNNIVLNSVFLVNQWENPNWVNAKMNFELVETDPQGNNLEQKGIHTITTAGNNPVDTKEKLHQIISENNWNPNEYINIYVGGAGLFPDASLPILEESSLPGLFTKDSDAIGNRDSLDYIYNGTNVYNSNTLGKYFGLYPTYSCDESEGCTLPIYDCRFSNSNQSVSYEEFNVGNSCMEDWCDDTYSYVKRYTPFFDGPGVVDLAVTGDTLVGACYLLARDCSV